MTQSNSVKKTHSRTYTSAASKSNKPRVSMFVYDIYPMVSEIRDELGDIDSIEALIYNLIYCIIVEDAHTWGGLYLYYDMTMNDDEANEFYTFITYVWHNYEDMFSDLFDKYKPFFHSLHMELVGLEEFRILLVPPGLHVSFRHGDAIPFYTPPVIDPELECDRFL